MFRSLAVPPTQPPLHCFHAELLSVWIPALNMFNMKSSLDRLTASETPLWLGIGSLGNWESYSYTRALQQLAGCAEMWGFKLLITSVCQNPTVPALQRQMKDRAVGGREAGGRRRLWQGILMRGQSRRGRNNVTLDVSKFYGLVCFMLNEPSGSCCLLVGEATSYFRFGFN